ncbi:bifunctional sulfate adenylyltransferase/adenylylsulfate kinase [Candidatus Woesebacteria bacterium]|nr:bifunctional sulfate adenylyltransferase/adenylylsulfate kinase [Candidatus Woesebacteria bacterium]
MKKSNNTYLGYKGPVQNLMMRQGDNSDIKKKLVSLPRLNLTKRQLCDLELLMTGAFSPLTGFMNEDDYQSVVDRMRLANDIVWSIPITLALDARRFKEGQEIILADSFGKALALMHIESIYKPDKEKEAESIYRTTNTEHFGVNHLFNEMGSYYFGGTIKGINSIERYDFSDLRHTPQQLQDFFREKKWDRIIGFQTRNPLHKVHYALIKQAAEQYQGNVLLHPAVGMTKDGDVDYISRVRSYIQLQKYIKDFSTISLLPLAMRMAGPKEALWHAIIRKNYGCTHFIVGRDHASPGKNSAGKNYYGAYDAQQLVQKYEKELGITVVPFQELVYVEEKQSYIPVSEVKKEHSVKKISGTQVRNMLKAGESIPEWFSFPEIIEELQKGIAKQKKDGLTIFFTGLSGAGKSTMATLLYYKLIELQDKPVTLLDGDIIRQNLSKGLGFSHEDRNENIKRIGFVADLITKHGGIAICSAIAPYAESRQMNRKRIGKHGRYVEIYISTPVEVCMQRDTKELYKKYKLGIIKGLTGLDDPYEQPEQAELTIDTTNMKPKESVEKIISFLKDNNYITIQTPYAQ